MESKTETYGKEQGDGDACLEVENAEEGGEGPEAPFRA